MKLFKSRKALSPVVASIILIAVTVAVSIAVAAWMGALTFTFTAVEELQMPTSSDVKFCTVGGEKYINFTVRNTGTSKVSIVDIKINGNSVKNDVKVPSTFSSQGASINPASEQNFAIKYTWQPGYKYRIELLTSSNKIFYQDYTAPS
ncbi:MAG: archaellin/type IV pilin N-terminal domain-containing protein [Candidatus Bathyarchaeia archaeon]